MVRRILSTLAALLVAVAAFCGAGQPVGINLAGVLFLFVAFVIWFEWEAIREGYSCRQEDGRAGGRGSDLMLVRMGPLTRREPDRANL
jgi:hypothetical protein